MSRQLDPEALDKDDVAYIKDRPFIRREFEMQGYGDPLSPDYPGLTFDPSDSDSPAPSPADDDDDEDDEDEEQDDPGYEDWNKDRLKAEIDQRNQGRNEDSQIVPESTKNAALAYALREDDKADTSAE